MTQRIPIITDMYKRACKGAVVMLSDKVVQLLVVVRDCMRVAVAARDWLTTLPVCHCQLSHLGLLAAHKCYLCLQLSADTCNFTKHALTMHLH